jgi:hypothetical protein
VYNDGVAGALELQPDTENTTVGTATTAAANANPLHATFTALEKLNIEKTPS